MSFARELAEAVEAPSIPEQITFLELLDEHLTTAVHTGFFTEETMGAAMVLILRESGVTEDDLDDVYEAIDEFLDEELVEMSAATKKKLWGAAKKHGKKVAIGIGKEIAKQAASPLAKKVAGIKTKSKTGKMLKHAAAGAIKQIGKDPGSAKKILVKSAKKAGGKLAKAAVKKGLKMVFGRWVKAEKGKNEELEEARRSSKRAEVERAFAKRGTIKMPRINPHEYPKIHGMEGPFQFRGGRILYYDPREGRYYDSKSDLYLDRNDIPEDVQEMLRALQEVDGHVPFELTEARLAKGLVPIFERAMGVQMDKRQAKLVVDEFVRHFRKAVEQKLHDYSEEPDVEDGEWFDFEDEGEYTPKRYQNISVHRLPGPGYYDEPYTVTGKTMAVTKMSVWYRTEVGVPDAVDLMAATLKRLFGNDAFIAARRNLARTLAGDQRIFMRLLEEAITTVLRSWKWDDLDTDAWNEQIREFAKENVKSSDEVDWDVDEVGEYTVSLDRVKFDRKLKTVSSTAGPASDVQVTFTSYWRVKPDEYPTMTHSAGRGW